MGGLWGLRNGLACSVRKTEWLERGGPKSCLGQGSGWDVIPEVPRPLLWSKKGPLDENGG